MRIGFYNGYDIWGGGEKWHYEMSQFCHESKEQVVVFTPKEGELSKRIQKLGIETKHISISKGSYYCPLFLFRTYKLLKASKLDVLVFNSYRDVRAAAFMARMAGVKKVVFRCGMPIAPKESMSYRLNFNHGLHYFVPISNAIQSEFDEKSPRLLCEDQKIPYIANGIDLKDFSFVKTTLPSGPIVLGNASRLSAQKGLEMLLAVAHKLQSSEVDFILKIAGDGEEEHALKELCEELGLSSKVKFIGHIDDVASFVKELDIYVFTSRYEGTARSMIEAMACGKPVVAFNTSSMKEVVDHDVNGKLARAFDIEDFYIQVRELIDDFSQREKYSTVARAKVEKEFNKVTNFNRWYKFLKA